MQLLSPAWLLLLVPVAVLVGAYVWLQLRKPRHAVRFTNLDLLDAVAPDRPGWRRHVVAGAFAAALVLLVIALAQPARTVEVPDERSTVVLAFDTSLSMEATDIAPSRLEAAQAAAIDFVRAVPDEVHLGLVSFNGSTRVEVEPTQDRQEVVAAIESLQLGEATAIGDAIATSVDEVIGSLDERAVAEDDGTGSPPGAVVLLSDGESTVGRPVEEGVAQAVEAGVPVSTIAYGTEDGVIDDPVEGEIPVPVDEDALRRIAEDAGGTAFDAASAAELDAVYANIGATIGYEEEQHDLSRWFLGAGVLALVVCGGLSLVWSSRIL